jgi:hypothetical protein
MGGKGVWLREYFEGGVVFGKYEQERLMPERAISG